MVLKTSIQTIILFGALAGVCVMGAHHRQTATGLRHQITALRQEHDRLEPLRSERQRLQQLQREIEQPDAANRPTPERAPQSREPTESNVSFPSSLAVGEWSAHTAWKNRGRATPAAALETMLWAAAGGDLATLKTGLLLDETVRTQTEALRAKLPPSAESLYTSPEELIAAFAATSTPLGDAQVVWQQQSDPDDAAICVFLKNTETTTAPGTTPLPDLIGKNNLATAPANSEIKTVYLNLHRTGAHGWRLVVPKTAVAKMTRDFVPPAAP